MNVIQQQFDLAEHHRYLGDLALGKGFTQIAIQCLAELNVHAVLNWVARNTKCSRPCTPTSSWCSSTHRAMPFNCATRHDIGRVRPLRNEARSVVTIAAEAMVVMARGRGWRCDWPAQIEAAVLLYSVQHALAQETTASQVVGGGWGNDGGTNRHAC
jgi:hypothetical protein